MVTLDIIKEQYSKMPDEELIRFAKNESQHLTIESFRLLITEFENRNLDIGILESIEIDKELAKLNKQSSFEQKTAKDFEQSILEYALTEKEKGSTNIIIYNELIQKGITEDYAFMFVQSLNWKVKSLIDSYDTNLILSFVFVLSGIIMFALYLNETIGPMFALYGFLLGVLGIFGIIKNYSNKQKYQAILKIIESEVSEIEEKDNGFNEQLN
ncbi:MAG: hypothetical protein M3139_12045 [Bacteroidota bacterium]|nr:hypothetical protein [Bacteroidota bacterium]